MNRPLFSLTAKAFFAGAFALGFAATSGATTYYWKGVSYVNSSFDNTAGYGSWSDLSNWSTVSESGADAATLPGSSDKIYGLVKYTWRQFDLDGGEWTISGWDTTGDWERHYWRFINGTLHWAGRNSTHSDTVHLDNGATFIFDAGSYYQPSTGHGATDEWRVHAGASLSMLGELEIYKIDVELDGGSMVFAPSKLKFHTGTAQGSWLKNSGTLSMPNGISFSGGAADGTFNFVQRPVGVLELGGPITKNGKSGTYNFTLKGGTVHVTGDVSFDFSSATVTADAPVTLNVDAGASIDFSSFTYSAGASVTKTGAGDFIFKSGMALPDTFTVSGGAVALGSSGSYDLSGVTFMSGSKVKIGAAGVTLSNWDSSISSATFVVADSYIPANGATVLTIADASLLAQAQAGLSASLAGTGVSVEISGNSLVAASHYTFNSSSVTDMNDTAGWIDGFAASAGQPAFVSGASTVAVMDYRVPAYSSISVEDGASLTVAATRNLPAATLAAGTELNVVSEIGRIAIESESYNGYIMNTATLVGTMAPSRSLSEITDIAGNIGGGWLGNKDRLYTYVNTKVLDDGAKLRAQFIYNDSDYTKCAFVEFTKDAQGNIYATGVGAGYIPPTAAQVDFDEIEYTSATYGTSDSDGAYGVKRLSFNAPVDCGGPSTVTAVGDFATTGSGSVTVDVATNCVLDLSGVDVTTAATLVKTGTGIIVFGDELPTALNISSGALALQPYVEYDMSDVTLGSGAEVKVVVDDTFKNGIAFVQPNGKTVYMSSGVYVGVGTWATTANWVNSEIPDASTAVHVHGSGTVLTLDDTSTTMPASISIEGGATLRVLADVTLPPLAIDATSKVVFGDNETYPAVSVTLAAAPATTSDATVSPVALPVIEVATNATLSVPGGTKFKNVNLRLFGTLAGNTLGRFYFGHAEYGESTYFAMCLTNATICTIGYGGNYDGGSLYFVCPESGGNVSVVGAIDVFNMMVDRRDDRGEESQYNGISFGVNNPTNLPFDVVFTDVSFWYLAQCKIAGAANLVLRNSYLYRKSSRAWAAQGRWTISDIAKVTYDNSRHFYEYPDGNSIGWNSAIDGYEAVILTNSTVQWSRPTGNSKSVMTVYDSYYDCAYDEYTPSQGQTLPDLMTGLGKLNIPTNAFYSIRGKSDVAWGDNGSGTARTAKIAAGVKFTGSGELRVENAESGKSFAVIMQNGENTAIGPVRVLSPANYDATLYFASGANWAGTVVAGDVSLTNLTAGAAASTVTFGTLDLAADFPIRVWRENGVLVNDTLNVGQYVNHGGKLVPQMLTDGASFAPGDRLTLGSIGADSPLPAVGRGWHCKLSDNGLDNDTKTLILSYSRGLQVILQ